MDNLQTATFAAGCFWGIEEAFRTTEGVVETIVGYMGGNKENPTYEDVCSHTTGHAEVTQVVFDSQKISYKDLLKKFWKIHDPTQVNRQGPDVGDQYRSEIFFHNEQQKEQAETSKREEGMSGKYNQPIATKISPASTFWKAEEYHQQYLAKKGLSTCPT